MVDGTRIQSKLRSHFWKMYERDELSKYLYLHVASIINDSKRRFYFICSGYPFPFPYIYKSCHLIGAKLGAADQCWYSKCLPLSVSLQGSVSPTPKKNIKLCDIMSNTKFYELILIGKRF